MHDKNTQADAVSQNTDHEARKAAMQERARMAIEGRRSAVGYDRTGDVAQSDSRPVSAQKNGKPDSAGAVNYNAEFLGDAVRTRKVVIQVRARRHGGRVWTDVSHDATLCGVEEMRRWVIANGDRRKHYRVIERAETTLLAPAEMLPKRKKTPLA